jgi:hypothetical protein
MQVHLDFILKKKLAFQSINAGFQALRQLLPRKDGDKMSKASILAATADFIQNLLHERAKLLEENAMSAAKRRRLDVGGLLFEFIDK